MVNYDSDSSADDQEFTETDVLLGYTSKEAGTETVSRLGGRPDWLAADKPPSAALARCTVCKDLTVLLLQLNAELPERFPGHERRLYVFACRRKSCRRQDGSIRAVRSIRVSAAAAAAAAAEKQTAESKMDTAKQQPPKTAASTGLGESLFGVKPSGPGAAPSNPFANPFSTTPAAASGNPFATKKPEPTPPNPESQTDETVAAALPQTFAEKLALNLPKTGPSPPPEPWPVEAEQPAAYPVAWIADAEYETLDPTPMPRVPMAGTMDLDESAAPSGGGKEDKEVFESSMDAAFQKFADRVGQNPDQVIRYEFGGTPLLYSREDAVGRALAEGGGGVKTGGMPGCGNCDAPRTFEVQLTPHAITELEVVEDGLDGMDWGTIIVGVCSKDCQERGVGDGEVGYLEEWAGVQWEELTAKRLYP